MRTRALVPILCALFLALCLTTCKKVPVNQPVDNLPPETHLYVEEVLDTIGAKQTLCWYGNDRDGYVVGYYWAVDDTGDRHWTEINCSTFVFESGSLAVFHDFYVWAEDNEGGTDPSPAQLQLPVINTAPEVDFVPGSVPKDTTFPVATFFWTGTDVDGDNTILWYFYRLDTYPDSAWDSIPAQLEENSVTLTDIEPGDRTFFLLARDNAGALSDTLTFPRIGESWHVKAAEGQILLVDDEPEDEADATYRDFLDGSGYLYSVWNVETGLPYSSADVNEVLNNMGFTTVLWYTGRDEGHVSGAEGPLSAYTGSSSNHLMIVSSSVLPETTSIFVEDILHVDTLTAPNTSLPPSFQAEPQLAGYPDLESEGADRIDGFEPDTLAEALYRLEDSPLWDGNPAVALRYPTGGPATLILFSIPLHKMNGQGNVQDLLDKIIREEFGN
jgi:hypothetical protein